MRVLRPSDVALTLTRPQLLNSACGRSAQSVCLQPNPVFYAASPTAGYSSRALAGRNIFQLRAAVGTAQLAPVEVTPAIELPTSDESDKLLRIRHSCAHIMAMAVQRLYKDAQVTIGPWIERGFYYDFDLTAPLTDKELKAIKKEMAAIARAKLPFVKEELSASEAEERIKAAGEPYKLEILQGILARDPSAAITIYHVGETSHPMHWWDLCAGPHVANTGDINMDAVALESVAGAYWRGDESKAKLQRVYGTAWETPAQLKAYTALKEEAARRDHRKLGQELDLFSIQESAGGGLVFWHPAGGQVRHQIESFWKELHLQRGYQMVFSPHVARVGLWKTSGHFDFYKESMFDQMQVENDEYQLKPMNCPFHVGIFKQGYYSYKDLPVRMAELGTVYRYERSGTMHGLFRVRGFTQDDAHIFCLPSQVAEEIRGVLDLVEEVLSTFGFTKYEVNLSTRPEKSVGDDKFWQLSEDSLKEALQSKGWDYKVDAGGGAFYGPKIDIKIQDAIGRKWQCSTVQLDYNLPDRFDIAYVDEHNNKLRPIMIHRAIFGSVERFFGILIENYAGAFPLAAAIVSSSFVWGDGRNCFVWGEGRNCCLVRLLTVNDEVLPYASKVLAEMRRFGIRAEINGGASISKLVRTATKAKTPVTCIIGKQEVLDGTLSVRLYQGNKEIGALPQSEVIARVLQAVAAKGDFKSDPASQAREAAPARALHLEASVE
ncbi:hypothetical protein QJQ45_012125 [Haematococcus lacustris]|nr:hypothetical protein QJQ45_012125 [Haematococcus lacustris]